MNSKYLRLPQEASDSIYTEKEKEGSGHGIRLLSSKNMILSLSVAANVILFLSIVLMLREKPTPSGFGKSGEAIHLLESID